MAIIKSEELVQERKQKQESSVTEWDRARGIIAKGLKLVGSILEGIAYIGLLLVSYENPSVINCGAEDLQQALEEFPLLAMSWTSSVVGPWPSVLSVGTVLGRRVSQFA